MKKIIMLVTLCLLSLNSFASPFGPGPSDSEYGEFDKAAKINNLEEILNQAEYNATTVGRKIIETSRIMITNQEIVVGSCWDFIHAAYTRAGYPTNQRVNIFKSKLPGPYVEENRIETGDWLYFINYSYNNVEHSGIFVAWSNLAKKEAVVISYPGGNQSKPGRYRVYDLSGVYNIIRPR